MKKGLKILGIILLVIIVLALIFFGLNFDKIKDTATMKAVVVKVNEKSLGIMNSETKEIFSVGFSKEGNIGFKKGQEILIFWDGMILTTYPGQIGNVWKIKIIKETSDVEIPENILRYYYSSRKNVEFTVSELTKTNISFDIKDTNELPYRYYFKEYKIYKKNKQAENVTIDYSKLTPATENSTPAYIPDNIMPLWEEAPKISNIETKNIEAIYEDDKQLKVTCDWTSTYGILPTGEYELVFRFCDEIILSAIRMSFVIDEKGEITYKIPSFE